jgi:mono/diheme cytochrome c family protein
MLQRMLVEKMENRILVGIVAFLGIMIMVGFVAIKENARMASFTTQYNARSIERGGEIFASNCATCHNPDGRGQAARAPALNNPHLFGYNYLAAYDDQLAALATEQDNLEAERVELATELAGGVTERRRGEIETRFAEIDVRLGTDGIPAELTALQAERDTALSQLTPAIDRGYDPATVRLDQANWGGSLEEYIFTTLVHGRGQNAQLWGGTVMSPWLAPTGPLREDQVRDVVAYVMNWDKGDDWTVEDLLAVNQFAQVPGAGGGAEVTADPAGTDVAAILAQWEEQGIVGDPVRGGQLYNNEIPSQLASRLGCVSCHAGGAQGPDTEGTWDRVLNERLTLPEFEGYTPEQYLVESIVLPNNYIVEGYQGGIMPQNFGERTSVQDLADIVEYLHSTSADYVPPQSDTTQQTTDNTAGVITNEEEPPAVTEQAESTSEPNEDPNAMQQNIPGGTTTAPDDTQP